MTDIDNPLAEHRQREKFAAMIEIMTKMRVVSNVSWTAIASKSTAMTAIDLLIEDTRLAEGMLIIDDNHLMTPLLLDINTHRSNLTYAGLSNRYKSSTVRWSHFVPSGLYFTILPR